MGNMSDHGEDVGSTGKGSGGKDLESKVESEGEGSNQEESRSESRESSSDQEGSGSGSSSSASESDNETPKAKADEPPPEAPSEMDHNISQAASIPKVNDKDSEDEKRSNCHDFAWSLDKEFGQWKNCMFEEVMRSGLLMTK